MQVDLVMLLLGCAAIALAVLVAVSAGTLAARLFFHASGLDPKDAASREKKPLR